MYRFEKLLVVGLLLIVLLSISASFFVVREKQENLKTTEVIPTEECDVWNGQQCIDPDSEWFGADFEDRVSYPFCKNYGEVE